MIEIRNKFIPFRGYKMMTVYPFLFIRTNKKETDIIPEYKMNHERIHARQQLYCILIGLLMTLIFSIFFSLTWYKFILYPYMLFYILYVFNWIYNLIRGSKDAYMDIIFEKEAYMNEKNLDYLKSSTFLNVLKYINKKEWKK